MNIKKIIFSKFINLGFLLSVFLIHADNKHAWVPSYPGITSPQINLLIYRFKKLKPFDRVFLEDKSQTALLKFQKEYNEIIDQIVNHVKTKSNTELVSIAKLLKDTSRSEILMIFTFANRMLKPQADFYLEDLRKYFEYFKKEFADINVERVQRLPDNLKNEKSLLSLWCDKAITIAEKYIEIIDSIKNQFEGKKPWI